MTLLLDELLVSAGTCTAETPLQRETLMAMLGYAVHAASMCAFSQAQITATFPRMTDATISGESLCHGLPRLLQSVQWANVRQQLSERVLALCANASRDGGEVRAAPLCPLNIIV